MLSTNQTEYNNIRRQRNSENCTCEHLQFILFGFGKWKKEIVAITKKRLFNDSNWLNKLFSKKMNDIGSWLSHHFLQFEKYPFSLRKIKEKKKNKITVQITCAHSHSDTCPPHTLFHFIYPIYNFVEFFSLLFNKPSDHRFIALFFALLFLIDISIRILHTISFQFGIISIFIIIQSIGV